MNDAFGRPQSVLVLGGSSDIARAIVRALVVGGARSVVLAGRSPAALEAAAGDARAAGADRASTLAFDATQVERHREVLGAAFSAQSFDLVLMAVGVLGDQDRDAEDPVAAAGVIWSNFAGPAAACLVAAQHLAEAGQGTLVVLSSVAGERVRRSNFIYGSSKAGLDGFAQGLGDSLAGSGVRVMVVRPGFVRTKMTAGMGPAPLAATPEQVAAAVVAGLAKRAETVWVPGAMRPVMAAVRHLPRAVFRRLPF